MNEAGSLVAPRLPPPTTLDVLLAPVRGLVRPAAAARRLAELSPRGQLMVFALHVLVIAAIVVRLAMWSVSLDRFPAGGGSFFAICYVTLTDSKDIWFDWHADGWIGPAEQIALAASAIVVAGTVLLAALVFVRVHRHDSLGRSWRTAFAAVLASGGALTVSVMVIGTWLVFASSWDKLTGSYSDNVGIACGFYGVPLGVLFVLSNLRRAVAGVADLQPAPELPPRCEGCGYDLTHRPDDDRCPECGLSISLSLTPGMRRTGSAWEHAFRGRETWRRSRAWRHDLRSALTCPTEFYSNLRVHEDSSAAASFAMRTYISICVLGWLYGLFAFVVFELRYGDIGEAVMVFTGLGGLWLPLLLWAIHRIVAALTTAWWLYRRMMPDYRIAAQVQHYEAVYLAVFVAFLLALFTSFLMFDDWLSQTFPPFMGRGILFFVPPEIVVFFGGLVLLALGWFLRYAWIARAVRWSNF